MTPAFLTRIQTLLTTGQPKHYAGSDLAKADWAALGQAIGSLAARSAPVVQEGAHSLTIESVLDIWERYPGAEFADAIRAAGSSAAEARVIKALRNLLEAVEERRGLHGIDSIESFVLTDARAVLDNSPIEPTTKKCKCQRLGDFDGRTHHPLCNRAAPGWHCSRKMDHAGPCAAHPDGGDDNGTIARSKRILALVDTYVESQSAINRNALRHGLHREFSAPRPLSNEQIAALRIAADVLIERYAEPIRTILRDANHSDG